jgi:hypothetical protein
VFLAAGALAWAPPTPAADPASKNSTRSYAILWDFDATKAVPAASGEIIIPVPSDEPYQRVRWELSGVRTQRVIKAEGGKLVAVRPKGATFRLWVMVEQTAKELPKPVDRFPMPADAKACLRDNAPFAARNPKTAKLAKELKAEDPEKTVENFRKWQTENLQRHADAGVLMSQFKPTGGIDSTLETKRGNCDAHSRLFAALCRQAGIPARVLWGPVKVGAPEVAVNKDPLVPPDSEFACHFWAEIYLEGRGWIPVEPQAAGVPLGQLPGGQEFKNVPFLRLPPEFEYFQDNAGVAVRNVYLMGGWGAKLQKAGEGPPYKKK